MKKLIVILLAAMGICAQAQEKQAITDSTETKAGKSERNMLLNAESATVPREINIGLPESGKGSVLYIDGAKHAGGIGRSQYHWAGGNAYEPVGSFSLMESLLKTGEISVVLDSRTKFGSDNFSGAITGMTSNNGMIRFDGAVNGPLAKAKGMYFALGAYVNFDPTSVNAPGRTYIDRKQIFQFSLSKVWKTSRLDMNYRFSLCNDSVDGGYSQAPFVYNGDGTISTLNGFRIGKDCYMPEDDNVRYMDIATGEYRNSRISKLDDRRIHDLTFVWEKDCASGWKLDASWHILYMEPSLMEKCGLSGIDKVDASKGYTYSDGTPFSGYVQNRLLHIYNTSEFQSYLRGGAVGQLGNHNLMLGFTSIYCDQLYTSSTVNLAHTAEANPDRLYFNGKSCWNENQNSIYMKGHYIMPTIVYAQDKWRINDRLTASTGIRLAPRYNNLWTAAVMDGEMTNKRVAGFNISDSNLCNLHNIKKFGLSWAVTEHATYRIAGRLFAMAEGFYSITAKSCTYFAGSSIPSIKPIGNAQACGGLMYDNSWMDINAVVSYIRSWNNAKTISVTKKIGGISEDLLWTAEYGIGTLGITLDGNVHFGGFKMHGLITWQDPRYHNYNNNFVFSDNSTVNINYTGKFVTGISQVIAELDPSYSWGRWRLWGSMRYYSRQYASRTNYAYFNGHIETFAGAEVKVGKRSSFSLNLVNLLSQNGAKGSIDIADTIDDPSELEGYVMAGSYIRPFTAELGYSYKF